MTEAKSGIKSKSNLTQLTDFKDLVEIGHGAFGKVYRAIYKKNQKAYALKKISIKQIKDQNMISQISTEIKISKSLDHPNIIKLYDTFQDEDHIYLVLQLAQHGQLYAKLMKQGRFTVRTAKPMIIDLIKAIQYLHSRNPPIVHRDIKPQNLLLDKNDKIKLADFGWSNFLNKPRKTYCGTFDYLAPEMIDKSGHDQKLDYWCLGVLVYELLTGKTPFLVSDKSKTENPRKLLEENILNVRLTFPDDFPTIAKSFVLGMIKRNPKQRMTLEQIKNHPWLKQSSQQIQNLPETKSSKIVKGELMVDSSNQIIKQLTDKIRSLQKQLNERKINEVKIQTPTNNGQYATMLQQMRKLKVAQQMNQKYQKDLDKLWGDLNQKEKEIITLKNALKNYQQVRQDLERCESDKCILQEKLKKLQRELQSSEQRQKQLKEEVNTLNDGIERKVRKGERITARQINSQEFINYLEDQLQNITNQFESSKKILNKVLERQKQNQEKQNQLIRLRIQQKNIRQEIRAQLKQYYQNIMDNKILSAREQLSEEREKWFQDYQQLKAIYDGNSSNDNQSTKVSDKQTEMQNELKNLKELNMYYQRSLKQRESQIKDLQELAKRKK